MDDIKKEDLSLHVELMKQVLLENGFKWSGRAEKIQQALLELIDEGGK
jgi:hypothetical protein